jgi:ubiquitin-conjugating enzyme E2 J2
MASAGCIRRLQQELKRLKLDTPDNMDAHPTEEDMLIWIFVVDGPRDSPYTGGEYLGRIRFAKDYPFKAPDFEMITPNGRFETNTKICLSYSSFHQETWNPSWNVQSMIQGLISFMAEESQAIATIKKSESERKKLAEKSRAFNLELPYYKTMFPARYAKAKGLDQAATQALLTSVSVDTTKNKVVAEAVENAQKALQEKEQAKAAAAEREKAAAAAAAAVEAAAQHQQVRRQREEEKQQQVTTHNNNNNGSKIPFNSASQKKKEIEVIELE